MNMPAPDSTLPCSSISRASAATFADPTIYEFQKSATTQTVTLSEPPKNCQERPYTIQFLRSDSLQHDPSFYTTMNANYYLTLNDAARTMTVDRNFDLMSAQFFINARYVDPQGTAYLDNPIQLRFLNSPLNTTLSNSKMANCGMKPFPAVYGGVLNFKALGFDAC